MNIVVLFLLLILLIYFVWDTISNANRNIDDTFLAVGFSFMLNCFFDLFDLFRMIIDFFLGKIEDTAIYFDKEVNWIFVIIGIVFILIGLYLKTKKDTQLFNIFTFSDKKPNIKDLLNLKENKIDAISFYNSIDKNSNCDEIQILKDDLVRRVETYKTENLNYKNSYTGIASIPIVLFCGTLLKEIKFNSYYEYNKISGKYEKLKNNSNFSNFEVIDFNKIKADGKNEIVLAFGITTKIKAEDLKQFKNVPKVIVNINRSETNCDNYIKSKKQINLYKKAIYDAIRTICSNNPKISRVHFIISSQSCLIIELGKLFEDRNLPEIISYQFKKTDGKKYSWGLIINGKNEGKVLGD